MQTWTLKLAASRSLRKLKAIENHVDKLAMEIAAEWGEVDQFIVNLCDQMRDESAELANAIRGAIKDRLEVEEIERNPGEDE